MYIPKLPYHETINKLLHAILQHFKESPETMTLPQPPYYNVTNDLLYAILNTVSAGGVSNTGFNILYVSSRYGNDAIAQINNEKKPWKTITAAKNNYFSSNDWIHVKEGTYDEGNLFGNIKYWFDNGAEVIYSAPGRIFHQWFGECTVRGYGKFKTTHVNGQAVNVGNWINCVLDMECDSIEAQGRAVLLFENTNPGDPLYKPHKIKARRIYANTMGALRFAFNSNAEVEADEIINDSFSEGALLIGNVTRGIVRYAQISSSNHAPVHPAGAGTDMYIDSCRITSNFDDPAGHGIFFDEAVIDNLHLYNTRIEVKNALAKSIYVTHDVNLLLDKNVTANADTGGPAIITYANKDTEIALDEIEVAIDVTGLSAIDLSAFQNAKLIRLGSSNPAETITQVTNAPLHHSFKLLPNAGLSLTINSADPLTAAQADIILKTASITLNGDKGDWLELRNTLYGTGNREVSALNY